MRFLSGADVPPDPDSGAAGTVVHIAEALRSLGHEVDSFWKAELGRRIQHGNLHYLVELPWTYRRAVAQRLKKQAYDVIMLSQPHAWRAARYVRHRAPNAVFLNLSHGWEGQVREVLATLPDDASPVARRAARYIMSALLSRHEQLVTHYASGMVVGTNSVARFLRERHGVPSERILVNPEGISRVFLDTPMPPPDPARRHRLLYVGQFTPVKAPERIAALFSMALAEFPSAEAVWICAREHHVPALNLVDANVRNRVTMLDWRKLEALVAEYDRCGLFIFPSHYEGFGKAPFEAMSRGLAVVASGAGGAVDLIENGRNGFVCPSGNILDMMPHIRLLLQQPEVSEKIGHSARQTAQHLTWTRYAKALIDFSEHLRTSNI